MACTKQSKIETKQNRKQKTKNNNNSNNKKYCLLYFVLIYFYIYLVVFYRKRDFSAKNGKRRKFCPALKAIDGVFDTGRVCHVWYNF